jgi:ABC-type multidrug transport system ATPase subunit
VLFSTHIVSDAESAADWVTILAGGKVVTSEPKARMLERWRRLVFSVPPSGNVGSLPPALKHVRPDGGRLTAVTPAFTPSLEAELRRLTGGTVEVSALGLEEVFRLLLMEGQ